MKRRRSSWARGWETCLACGCLALVLVGCGREGGDAASAGSGSTPAPARGEPIRGEAIRPSPPTTPAETGSVVAASGPGAVSPATADAAQPTATPATATSAAPSGVAVTNVASVDAAAKPGEALSVGFDKLASFQYTLPEGPVDTNVVAATQASAQIPDPIKALNNRFISLKGFMLPLKVEKGLVTELLIMRDQSMCCYGTVPKINEWVSVKMVGAGVKPIMDQAVTLFGKLKVGEMYENGYLVGIYALDGERMAGPLDM